MSPNEEFQIMQQCMVKFMTEKKKEVMKLPVTDAGCLNTCFFSYHMVHAVLY